MAKDPFPQSNAERIGLKHTKTHCDSTVPDGQLWACRADTDLVDVDVVGLLDGASDGPGHRPQRWPRATCGCHKSAHSLPAGTLEFQAAHVPGVLTYT